MQGKLFLLVGPSGSGKSSVLSELKKRYPDYVFPLSATTRAIREGEKEGEVYHFLSKEEFKKGIDSGRFLEWAIVHQDNYYGLIKAPIMEALEEGKTIIREEINANFQSNDGINNKNQTTAPRIDSEIQVICFSMRLEVAMDGKWSAASKTSSSTNLSL